MKSKFRVCDRRKGQTVLIPCILAHANEYMLLKRDLVTIYTHCFQTKRRRTSMAIIFSRAYGIFDGISNAMGLLVENSIL